MRERKLARRILKSPHAGILDKMFARLVLDPEANKPDPSLNWWGSAPAAKKETTDSPQTGMFGLLTDPDPEWASVRIPIQAR